MDMIAEIEKACNRKAELNLLPMQDGDVPATFADIDAVSRDLCYRPDTPIGIGAPLFVKWFRQ